jgi:hypothetical protein
LAGTLSNTVEFMGDNLLGMKEAFGLTGSISARGRQVSPLQPLGMHHDSTSNGDSGRCGQAAQD